jgi:hypothetical protein
MANKSKGSRFGLGEPWQGLLADFCAAHYNAPERDIIRAALDSFIQSQLNLEPEMKKRFEDARKKRLGQSGEIVRLIPSGK